MAINLQRDGLLFVVPAGTAIGSIDSGSGWKIPVLAGFNFSQDAAFSDISLNEAGAAPIRGQKRFNDALNPADVSFTTYVRPYVKTGSPAANIEDVNMLLWEALVGAGPAETNATGDATDYSVVFDNSDVHQLYELDLYFTFGGSPNPAYKVSNFTAGQVDIDFAIDAITSLAWTGQGTSIAEMADADRDTILALARVEWNSVSAGAGVASAPADTAGDTFIKNKFTTCVATSDSVWTPSATGYTLAITGGSVTISNNITHLVPEQLGIVNESIGHFTGTRSITGSLTCYLRTGATASAGLFNDFQTLANKQLVNNSFGLVITVGGATAPKMALTLGTAHLVVPSINVEDVVSSEIQFIGQGSTGLEGTDELTVDIFADAGATWT